MRRPLVYALVVALLTGTVSGALALGVALRANAESDRKVCGLVVVMDGAYRESPAQTPAGQRIQVGVAKLRQDLDCQS